MARAPLARAFRESADARRHDRKRPALPRHRDQGPVLRRRRPQPRARRQHHGRAALDRRRRDPRIHTAPGGGAASCGRLAGPERDRDGRQRRLDDAFRFGRDRADNERDRRLWHGGGHRTDPGIMGAMRVVLLVIAGLLVAGGVAMAVLCIFPAAIGLGAWGVILLIGLLIERWRVISRSASAALARIGPRPASALSIRKPASWSRSITTRRTASAAMSRSRRLPRSAQPSR